ncbi:MAG: glycerophosphodiester phosphodiesterase [Anaerolineales bacterium]|nr:glycerophosphodiester phosphodiesterase [Anaerolineales bacterium]
MKPMPTRANRPHIIGHRGAQGLAPENTLKSFQTATDLGADGVEFDVQRSADGQLVIFHDDTVDRTTNGTGVLRLMTFDAIRQLDAGDGEQVPTLDEVLDLFRTNDLILHVELKDCFLFPDIEQQVIERIRAFGMVERCQLRSFEHDALHRAYAIAPEIAYSELWFAQIPVTPFFKTVNAYHSLYTAENLRQLHEQGVKATAWTVNEIETAQHLLDIGIDGLTTDYPDRLLPLIS